MAVCEACGARFTPTAQAPDCPSCAAAAKPAARASAPAAKPAVRRAPAPQTASSASVQAPRARPATPPPAARPAAPARAAAPARGGARPRPSEPDDEGVARRPREDSPIDKTTKVGLIVTGAFALIVLCTVLWVRGKKAEERRVADSLDKEVTALVEELRAVNLDDESAVNRALARAKEQEPKWRDHAFAADVQSLVGRTQSGLETGKERRDVIGRFDGIEGKLRGSDGLTTEKLKEIRRELDELEPKADLGGPELVARYALARTSADKLFAQRSVEEVKSSSSDNPRIVLLKAQVAEDDVKGLLDRAMREKNAELETYYVQLFEQAVSESDKLVSSIFSGGEAEKLPWIDLLSGAQVANWNASDVKGFSHRVEGGALLLNGPDADAGRTALISIGDREQWRNLVADMEFTIERGNLEVYFRLGRGLNMNTPSYFFTSEGEKANVQPNRSYRVVATLLGSEYTIRFDNAPDLQNHQETLTWRKTRKGAIGFGVPPGARIKFTRLQVRELR